MKISAVTCGKESKPAEPEFEFFLVEEAGKVRLKVRNKATGASLYVLDVQNDGRIHRHGALNTQGFQVLPLDGYGRLKLAGE